MRKKRTVDGKKLKAQLTRSAKKKRLTGARRNAYIYGTQHRVALRGKKRAGKYKGAIH